MRYILPKLHSKIASESEKSDAKTSLSKNTLNYLSALIPRLRLFILDLLRKSTLVYKIPFPNTEFFY